MITPINKIVVSDTTAITYLSKIREISLLRDLFKIIYIPEAVYKELTRQDDHIPGAIEVKIMDERDGRKEAMSQGLKVTGMLGIFLKAKEKKRIALVKSYLDKLRLTNFKLSPQLYEAVLVQAGEKQSTKRA